MNTLQNNYAEGFRCVCLLIVYARRLLVSKAVGGRFFVYDLPGRAAFVSASNSCKKFTMKRCRLSAILFAVSVFISSFNSTVFEAEIGPTAADQIINGCRAHFFLFYSTAARIAFVTKAFRVAPCKEAVMAALRCSSGEMRTLNNPLYGLFGSCPRSLQNAR